MKEIAREEMLWDAVMHEKAVHDVETIVAASLISQAEEPRADFSLACPYCTNYLPPNTLECPSCRTSLTADIAEAIRNISYEVAYFGILYRTLYEKDINDGQIDDTGVTKHYFISPPDDMLLYLVSLALSGIIGGLAYDAIKASLKTALREIQRANRGNDPKSNHKRFSSEYDLANADLFLEHVKQYLDSMLDDTSTQFNSRVTGFEEGLIAVESIRIRREFPATSVDKAEIIDRLLPGDPTKLSPEGKEYVRLAWSFRQEIQTLETYMKGRAHHSKTRKSEGKEHRKSE